MTSFGCRAASCPHHQVIFRWTAKGKLKWLVKYIYVRLSPGLNSSPVFEQDLRFIPCFLLRVRFTIPSEFCCIYRLLMLVFSYANISVYRIPLHWVLLGLCIGWKLVIANVYIWKITWSKITWSKITWSNVGYGKILLNVFRPYSL